MFAFLPIYAKIYLLSLSFLAGTLFGSALNCFAYRMVHKQSWTKGRSACPDCGHTLKLVDLVPIFSFLFLRGKCRYCGAKLSPRYMLTELLLGAAFLSVVWCFGLTLQTVSALVLVCCLFSLSLIDLDIQIIPDRFLLIPAVVRIAQLVIEGGFHGLLHGVLPGLIFGGGLLVLSLVMDKVLKKESMGGGDIKLMAVLGLYFTIPECLLLLVFACVLGILIAMLLKKAKPDTPFPFGPTLSLAAWLTLLVGEPLIHWYLHLFF